MDDSLTKKKILEFAVKLIYSIDELREFYVTYLQDKLQGQSFNEIVSEGSNKTKAVDELIDKVAETYGEYEKESLEFLITTLSNYHNAKFKNLNLTNTSQPEILLREKKYSENFQIYNQHCLVIYFSLIEKENENKYYKFLQPILYSCKNDTSKVFDFIPVFDIARDFCKDTEILELKNNIESAIASEISENDLLETINEIYYFSVEILSRQYGITHNENLFLKIFIPCRIFSRSNSPLSLRDIFEEDLLFDCAILLAFADRFDQNLKLQKRTKLQKRWRDKCNKSHIFKIEYYEGELLSDLSWLKPAVNNDIGRSDLRRCNGIQCHGDYLKYGSEKNWTEFMSSGTPIGLWIEGLDNCENHHKKIYDEIEKFSRFDLIDKLCEIQSDLENQGSLLGITFEDLDFVPITDLSSPDEDEHFMTMPKATSKTN